MERIGLAMRFMFAAAMLLTNLPVLRAAEASVAGRTLKEWIADLDAKDALVREEALEVLPEFGSDAKPATPKILKLYETDVPSVRYQAALAIWQIDGRAEPAQTVLSDALKTGSRSKRLQAALLLSQLERPASELAGPLLELMTGEPDYNVQNQVQVILAQFGSDAAPAMKDALAKARGDQRIQFMTLIQNLGSEFRLLLPQILEIGKDADPRTRFAAIRTIYVLDPQNKQVLADIVEASKSKDERERFVDGPTLFRGQPWISRSVFAIARERIQPGHGAALAVIGSAVRSTNVGTAHHFLAGYTLLVGYLQQQRNTSLGACDRVAKTGASGRAAQAGRTVSQHHGRHVHAG